MDAGTPTPSLEGAVPTLGALLVLLFATKGTLAARLLSLPPMVGIGLVSYSAYLWHQPLFAFVRLANPDHGLGPVISLVLIALTFLLAWATLVLIERPFRDRSFLTRNQVFLGSLGGTVALLACAGIVLQTGGLRGIYPDQLRELATMSDADQAAYVGSACGAAEKQIDFAPDERPQLMLIGDSFSEDFCNMIRETGAFADYQVIVRHIQAKCQIYLGPEDTLPLIQPEDRNMCAHETRARDLVDLTREADVVVFAARWRPWAVERLPTTLRNFGFRPDQTVIVIGRKSFARINRPSVAGASLQELVAMRSKPNKGELDLASAMRAVLPDGVLVDPYAMVCPNASCPVFTPDGQLISWDGSHLTRAGAAYVGAKLFADPPLARFAAGTRVGGPDEEQGAAPEGAKAVIEKASAK